MRLWRTGLAFAVFSLVCRAVIASPPTDEAARVVILANADEPSSVELARFYAEKRAVPTANIVTLSMPREETISWSEFSGQIFNPLLSWLIEHGWIDATPGELRDAAGRMRVAPFGHRISYLVTVRGVPLRIAHDTSLPADAGEQQGRDEFRTNRAAVDSELALLAWTGAPATGFVENPLYQNRRTVDAGRVVRVSRIDGPSQEACRKMIESALAGERRGVAGRAYVDLGGPHPNGDTWLRQVAADLEKLHFDVTRHEGTGVFAVTDRFDAPAFYFGWYAANLVGPFSVPGFEFPPGAVAFHIHSFSATTVRSASKGWVGPLIDRGVAATVGNVFEPYLEFSHRPDLFLERLASGATLGEAACFALPALSWQAIVFGDPLYRPFAVSLDDQWSSIKDREDPSAGYVAIRAANRAVAAGRSREAEQILEEGFRVHPSLALGLRLARARFEAGRKSGAERAMSVFGLVSVFQSQEIALVAEAADFLSSIEDHRGAVRLYRRLLEDQPLELGWRRALLPRAIAVAEAGGFSVQLKYWREAWETLNEPAVNPAP